MLMVKAGQDGKSLIFCEPVGFLFTCFTKDEGGAGKFINSPGSVNGWFESDFRRTFFTKFTV